MAIVLLAEQMCALICALVSGIFPGAFDYALRRRKFLIGNCRFAEVGAPQGPNG